ncbi:MAG: hypothetical protein HWD60_09930 [Defluviicoccus sp.]|nr:MAG: hypothetical protein HWD60_09930 [Defluviicoccus sp.]
MFPRPPAPAFSFADLEQARDEGIAQGRAAALADVQVQIDAERTRDTTLLAIAERLSTIQDDVRAAADQAGRDAVRIAETMVRTLMPDLYARHGAGEIEAMVETALAQLPTDQMITVRIAPALSEELAPLLKQRAEDHGLGEQLRVCGDGAVAPGDCALEWAGGGLLRDQNSLWRDIEALIEETVEETSRRTGVPQIGSAMPAAGESHD